MDLVDKVIAFEMGDLEEYEEVLEFFQELVDTGMVWTLQGRYGRTAQNLIDAGLIKRR